MKTDLELALECVVNIYHQYAMKWPIDDYLNRTEFSMLLKETAKPFLHNTKPPNMSTDDYISSLFVRADRNRNGRLKFTEFLTTLSLVAIDAHNRFHQHPHASQGQGQDHVQDQSHGHGHSHGH
ncbi:protein S100-A12-like [Pelecanus crispus]|uniref:protein S100-A12-like n=1 Tax=Pelecanus crispus TaxID=36300 RepID=UPI000510990D|nr:PREDICTED: protein S100-A7-like [Pelecanus crispus]